MRRKAEVALDFGRAQETDVQRKVFVNPSDGRKSLGSCVDDWVKILDVAETMRQTYPGRLNAVILPKCGDTQIGDITSMGYKAWQAQLKSQYKEELHRRHRGCHAHALDARRGGAPYPVRCRADPCGGAAGASP